MKKLKYTLTLAIAISLLFSSCNQLPSPDSTIKPPISNVMEKYNKILGIKLQDFIPSDSVLTSPRNPDVADPVVKKDLDGDGVEEIIVTYKTNAIPAEARAVILKKSADKWVNVWDKLHGAFDIESVEFTDITDDGLPEAIFTWGCPPYQFVSYNIVSNQDKHIRSILKSSEYNSTFEIKDLPGIYGKDGKLEIVFKEGEDNIVLIHALRWYEGAFLEAEDINVLYRNAFYKKIVQDKIKNTAEKDKTPDFWLNLSELQIEADLPDQAIKSIDTGLLKIKTEDFTSPRPEFWQFSFIRVKALNALGKRKEARAIIKDIHPIIEKSNIIRPDGYPLELIEMYVDNGDYNTASELLKKYYNRTIIEQYTTGSFIHYDIFRVIKLQQHIEELKLEKELNFVLDNSKNISVDKLSQKINEWGQQKNVSVVSKTAKDDKNSNPVLLCDINGDSSALLHCVFWIYNGKLFKQIFYPSAAGYNGFVKNFKISDLKAVNDNGALYITGLYKNTDNAQNNIIKFLKIKKDKCDLIYSQDNVKENSIVNANISEDKNFTIDFSVNSGILIIKSAAIK